MARESHPTHLVAPPVRKGADSAEWVVVINDGELSLVLYNTYKGQLRTVVATEKRSLQGVSLRSRPQTVYGMAAKIDRDVKDADDLEVTLKCEVRLVNLNTV
jgi:hypothetical protein